MKRWLYGVVILLLVTSGAWGTRGDSGVGVKIGTPGIGLDYTLGINEKVNLRLSGNYFSYTYDDFEFDEDDEEIDDVVDTIELTIDLLSIGALVDWHPGAGAFRLSAGAFYNGNEGRLTVTAGDTIEVDDAEYEVQRLDGLVEFNSFAPYVGFGWGNAACAGTRWHFTCDLGVMLQGSPKIDLSATATDPTLQNQLNAALQNEEDDLEDDAEAITVYPVVTLGLAYTF